MERIENNEHDFFLQFYICCPINLFIANTYQRKCLTLTIFVKVTKYNIYNNPV